jgi:hypothetical protein
MSNTHDRRAPGTARIPFEAMVEVGGSLGPSFEAQAVNLSEEGMSLRTAYLPEVGQPVMCRFDAGMGTSVVASGEVIWNEDMGNGGEFGIRFTNLDPASTVGLQRILGVQEEEGMAPPADPGRKVRLHIEGLASPMRARIKDQMSTGVTAYSELGFLQMGKPLELEDATSGTRRPASIDRVQVEVDAASRIPQLVVSLRYDDEAGRAASLAGIEVPAAGVEQEETPHDHAEPEMNASQQSEDEHEHEHEGYSRHEPVGAEASATRTEEEASLEEESNKLKSAFARNAAKVTPALMSWAKRAKVTAALLAAKARRGASTGEDVEIPVRRTTAPAPGGGLHASGRKVVRGSMPEERVEEALASKGGRLKITKKKVAVGASIGIATILVLFALKKPAAAPQLAAAPPADTAAAAAAIPTTAAANLPAAPAPAPVPPPADPLAAAAAQMANGGPGVHAGKPGKITPITNGPVGSHPTVIKIKMDGLVEAIHGDTQPTGFTFTTPNRKAVDPTGSLASKDPRLEGVRVANEGGGAEFTVTFKDGVPNYIVRAHGDTLEVLLAKASGPAKEANANAGSSKKHGKKSNKRH